MSEPVEFEAVVGSVTAALVNAARTLAVSNQQLDAVFGSIDELRDLPRPALMIDDVSIELAYVVEDVRDAAAPAPELAKRRDVRFADAELKSLRRGADADAVGSLDEFAAAYAGLKGLYQAVATDPAQLKSGISLPQPVKPSPAALEQLRRGASGRATQQLQRMLTDYQETRTRLVDAIQQSAAPQAKQLLVRLDPEHVNEAASVHRLALHFKVDQLQKVEVDGRAITVPE